MYLNHRFTRSEIRQAEHDFNEAIRKYFGGIWQIKSDGKYIGKAWDCRSMIAIYGGLWRLCQAARHDGAVRAAGRIEVKDTGSVLRFIIFYDRAKDETKT